MPDPFHISDQQLQRLQESSLVNVDRIFALIRRSFPGSGEVIATELLQNSQRAGAQHVWIDFTHTRKPDEQLRRFHSWQTQPWYTDDYTSLTYRDDGVGLVDGPRSLLALLRLGESAYSDQVMQEQDPLGVGFYSLVANEAVHTLTIRSRQVAFELDPERWWTDSDYGGAWLTRIQPQPDDVPGYTLTVEATSEFLSRLHQVLCAPETMPWALLTDHGPAAGFADLLDIRVEGEPPSLELPSGFDEQATEFVADYAGNEVRFGPADTPSRGLLVNWYGQLVHSAASPCAVSVSVHVVVRHGQPLTMQAPVRAGTVIDEKLHAFTAFLQRQVWERHTRAGHVPSTLELRHLYELDAERARAEVPYVIVRRVTGVPAGASDAEDLQVDPNGDGEEVVPRARLAALTLVEGTVLVVRPPDATPDSRWFTRQQVRDAQGSPVTDEQGKFQYTEPVRHDMLEYPYGIESFVDLLGLELYQPVRGCEATHTVLWRPGSMGDDLVTTSLGHYAVAPLPLSARPTWIPLPVRARLFVYEDSHRFFAEEQSLFVGAPDRIAGLYAFARLVHDHDDNNEDCCDDFDAEVDAWVREHYLTEPAIPCSTQLTNLGWKLHRAVPALEEQPRPPAIASVEFLASSDPAAAAGADASAVEALRVHLVDGQVLYVRLYGD